ncbi:MAG TPA: isoprenylcysteine carboxylmethyltransferase family protein [Thermoanaerobaculia bacterium]|nr:isoprenylcysteine carboxylmethyltransferase family protein [Thermoanaerobaculia bacterium]
MRSEALFLILIAAVGCERLAELAVSRRHERRLRARGAVEVGAGHYPWMVALHTALLLAAPAEVLAWDRPFLPRLGWPMLALVAATMALRWWVVATLGDRWTTRVLVTPGALPLVAAGPYRLLRHPNYLAVVLELAALPLVHTAWVTALVASLANAAVLAVRVRVEERALGLRPPRAGPPAARPEREGRR